MSAAAAATTERPEQPGRPGRTVDVLVIGAGPAGLAAARALAAAGAGTVEVVDREEQAGGTPRHCCHWGFRPPGLGPPTHGPGYARHWCEAATAAGAALRTGVSVTGWAGPRTVDTTSARGLERLTARAVVLATGARERPRSARLVPGSRPAGVFTAGELQQAVHLLRLRVGRRAVVVGAEDSGGFAARTLRNAGAEVAALVTDRPRLPSPWSTGFGSRVPRGTPVLTGACVTELLGQGRLSGVALRFGDGRTAVVDCDTVVFTGDWIPDHELARSGGIALDRGTRGPAVDTSFRTEVPGVFAVGDVLHAVEPASTAAREGTLAAPSVLRFLTDGRWPRGALPVGVAEPLLWVAPNRVEPGGPRPALGRFALRTAHSARPPAVLVVRQDGRVLHRERQRRGAAADGRLYASADWTGRADPGGGPVVITAG